jgi:hypothetical protein
MWIEVEEVDCYITAHYVGRPERMDVDVAGRGSLFQESDRRPDSIESWVGTIGMGVKLFHERLFHQITSSNILQTTVSTSISAAVPQLQKYTPISPSA